MNKRIEHDARRIQEIDADFLDYLKEEGIDESDWQSVGMAIRDYTRTDRFFSFFYDGDTKEMCMSHWTHHSVVLHEMTQKAMENL